MSPDYGYVFDELEQTFNKRTPEKTEEKTKRHTFENAWSNIFKETEFKVSESLNIVHNTILNDLELLYIIELPGADRKSLNIRVEDNQLVIKYTKKQQLAGNLLKHNEAIFSIPQGFVKSPHSYATATYEDGVLLITIPRYGKVENSFSIELTDNRKILEDKFPYSDIFQ